MQGFGVQTRNINELIAMIEQEIQFITKNMDKNVVLLNNKLSLCASELSRLKADFAALKDYTEAEHAYIERKITEFDGQIEHIKENLNRINYMTISGGSAASGIAPLSVYEQTGETFPIYAKFAEKDISGRNITETYLSKADMVSSTSAMYKPENKTKLAQVQAITGMMSVNEEKHQLILGF